MARVTRPRCVDFDLQFHKQSLNLLLRHPNNTPTTTSHRWIEAPAMASEACPVFPEDAGISYLNEGAANIVYRISIRYPTPQPSQLEEYGDNTPPPTEIEVLEDNKQVDLSVFDSKRSSLTTSSRDSMESRDGISLLIQAPN